MWLTATPSHIKTPKMSQGLCSITSQNDSARLVVGMFLMAYAFEEKIIEETA
jgi:hypothetical protein